MLRDGRRQLELVLDSRLAGRNRARTAQRLDKQQLLRLVDLQSRGRNQIGLAEADRRTDDPLRFATPPRRFGFSSHRNLELKHPVETVDMMYSRRRVKITCNELSGRETGGTSACADAEQLRDDAGRLMCVSSSSAYNRLWRCALTGALVLTSHQGAPEPLLRVGHEGESQFLGDQGFLTTRHPGSPSCGPRACDSIALGRDGACPRAAEHRRVPGVWGANAVPALLAPAASTVRSTR